MKSCMNSKLLSAVKTAVNRSAKICFGAMALAAYLSPVFTVINANAQTLNLSDLPLNVESNVPPNIVVSMDDSGSMAWGWMPDGRNNNWDRIFYRSTHYNKIYYDPTVSYTPPSTSTGAPLPDATFTSAIHGYFYETDNQFTVDLSSSYGAIYYHYSYGDIIVLAANAQAEYGCDPTVCADEAAYYFDFNDDITVNPTCTGTDAEKLINDACYNKVVITNALNYSVAGAQCAGVAGLVNANCRTQAEEQTNFANWYQYYSIRGDAGKTALMRAFVPDSVDDSVRIGRQNFNTNRAIQSGAPDVNTADIAQLNTEEREDFYAWVESVPTDGGTPLRNAVYRAGEYYKNDEPYRENPQNSSSDVVACRVNTHILVTDGFYNGGFTEPNSFARDQTGLGLPDSEVYNPNTTPIYSNSLDSQSISDLTFHYWATDLLSVTDNLDPYYIKDPITGIDSTDYWDPANDPATWQHMNSFSVAFGAEGSVGTDAATYASLLDGTQAWPQTVEGQPSTIDDLYHSSINGRGAFFNAANPDELVSALGEITDRVADRQASAPTVVANSGRIGGNSLIYVASFDTGSWSGKLEAFDVSDGSDFVPTAAGSAGNCDSFSLGTLCGEPVWDAADQNTEDSAGVAPSTRTIYSYSDTSAAGAGLPSGSGINFSWSATSTSLDAGQQAALNRSDGLGQERLNYLRGDDSQEVDNNGPFRTRSSISANGPASRVGPIINSSPVYVGNGSDSNNALQFSFPDDLEAASYSAHISSISSRTPMLYAGGNDGMLHGYNASRSVAGGGGREEFAYVPNKVIANLHELTDPDFQAGAYVDGRITAQDVFYGGSWETLLVGGLRTGGQGYYGLEVTNPTASAADMVLWEFTDVNDADMGFSYAKPLLVKANNGRWVVIVANGYNSTIADGHVGTGRAVLYVLDAADGEMLAKISVGSGNLTTPSGLSSPVAASDRDINVFADKSTGTDPDDFTVDYVYAGDLAGNLWKFDLSSSNPGDWSDGYLLYAAGSGQPITAQPAVGSTLARSSAPNNADHRYVYFGTGQYLAPSDISTTNTQAFYGIIDDDTCTSSTSACISSGDLTSQTQSSDGRVTSAELATNSKGWDLALTVSGASERVIGQAALSGSIVLFPSVLPESDVCNAGGQGFLYALDRFTGGQTKFQILDINSDGVIDASDYGGGDSVAKKQLGYWTGETAEIGGVGGVSGNSGEAVSYSGTEPTLFNPFDRVGQVRWRQLK